MSIYYGLFMKMDDMSAPRKWSRILSIASLVAGCSIGHVNHTSEERWFLSFQVMMSVCVLAPDKLIYISYTSSIFVNVMTSRLNYFNNHLKDWSGSGCRYSWKLTDIVREHNTLNIWDTEIQLIHSFSFTRRLAAKLWDVTSDWSG